MDEIKSMLLSHADQLFSTFESFSADLKQQWQSGKFSAPIVGFIHAVDWTEPWLIGLLCFLLIIWVVALMTRKHTNLQMALFLAALGGVYFAEDINSYLASRWNSFASQNYFDRSGIFLSTVWSGPLLIISTTVLINTLFTLTQLIVKWKKAEIRHNARAARKKTE
eukprot:TRINITY_DN29568_c0_g1_i1.p1 TRINITY_DN29568_c0_g1~~TRINITY_DN29568_c0_g1_i1.p1  ORF type:complete len:166 (-),score=13.88 TRINITY_DN29568_c0_g1_i1:104-601(-)